MRLPDKFIVALVALFIACIPVALQAQDVKAPLFSPLPSREAADQMLKRPLVLCKKEVDPKQAEKLRKKNPEQLQFEEAYNEYFNETLKMYFDKLYKGSKNIELKSLAEVNSILTSGSSSVAVVMAEDRTRSFVAGGMNRNQDTYSFRMILPDKKKDELIISYMNSILSDADFVFLIQQINIHLEKISKGEQLPSYDYTNKNTASKLKNLKLIVNLEKLDEDIKKENIVKKYTYPIEFVDSLSEYENIIIEQRTGYAYITSIWSSTLWGAGYLAVDAGTGEILSIMGAGGVNVSIAWRPKLTGNSSMDRFNKRHFAFDVVKFKPKHELKENHFKYLNKFVNESK